jgi:hypothetical protein
MRKISDFIKLWWAKIFKFTTKKNFVYIYPVVLLILIIIFTRSFLVFLGLVGWWITIISNATNEAE